MIRSSAAALGIIVLALLLGGCFLIGNPPNTFGVSLFFPTDGTEPTCYEVHIVGVLGDNTLVDAVRNSDDGIGYADGIEARESGKQRYYVGMPLAVDVSCRDVGHMEIGSARYQAKLMNISTDARFTVQNYLTEDIQGQCVEAVEQAGVQLCATIQGGFVIEPSTALVN